MKTTKKTAKAGPEKPKKAAPSVGKSRKMEPLKAKETKNQRFDDFEEDDDQLDPEMMDENFKGFDDFISDEDDDE